MQECAQRHLLWQDMPLSSETEQERKLRRTILQQEIQKDRHQIIVLDDDPTGVQTVHDVSVYTGWDIDSIREGFREQKKLFFILTNSRSFTEEQTIRAHQEIIRNIEQVSQEEKVPFLLISRGDSTLRGHFPLETQILQEGMERIGQIRIDGEILCPFFQEGGRFTFQNIHYVKYGEELVPAAQTEFARDETFGYHSSNLCDYVEEKTKGEYSAESCLTIPLSLLQGEQYDEVEKILLQAAHFQKIIVNALEEKDTEVFCIAMYRAMRKGRHFLVRCAASFVKAISGQESRPYLTGEQMLPQEAEPEISPQTTRQPSLQAAAEILQRKHGGIIAIGSHTEKTTLQMEELRKLPDMVFLEMNSDLVLIPGALEKEVEQLLIQEEKLISQGKSVVVSTRRKLLKVEHDTPQDALLRSVKISDALQNCVGKLNVRPAFVIAKGGITSSDIGVKALHVRRATVLGQAGPGIPVWRLGAESLFPGIAYVIFPGNVGEKDSLRKVAEKVGK